MIPAGKPFYAGNLTANTSQAAKRKLSYVGSAIAYSPPTGNTYPSGITEGIDENAWFTEYDNGTGSGAIALCTTGGLISEFKLRSFTSGTQTYDLHPFGNVTNAAGYIWFAAGEGYGVKNPYGSPPTFTEYFYGATDQLNSITVGPDNNLWMTDDKGNGSIIRMSSQGANPTVIATLSHELSEPESIVTGPDNALWFSENNEALVGRITTGGALTEYALGAHPGQIVNGGDGYLYLTEPGKILKFLPSNPTAFTVTSTNGTGSDVLALGPNNIFWFTDPNIAYLPRSGGVATDIAPGFYPGIPSGGMIVGYDNNMWAADRTDNYILEIDTQVAPTPTPSPSPTATPVATATPTATPTPHPTATPSASPTPSPSPTPTLAATQFPVPTANSGLGEIANGSDGAMWFIEKRTAPADGALGRITTGGSVTEYPLASYVSGGTTTAVTPSHVTAGPTGQLWYTTNLGVGYMSTAGDGGTNILIPGLGKTRGLSYGPDGNFYISTTNPDAIVQVTPSGTSSTFYSWGSASSVLPRSVITGPDGNLWFVESGTNKVGTLTLSGALTEYAVTVSGTPYQIAIRNSTMLLTETETTGPTEYLKVNTSGVFGGANVAPTGCCLSGSAISGQNLWTGGGGDTIVEFPGGAVFTTYGVGFATTETGFVIGSDGNLWGPNPTANTIDRIIL